MGASQLWTSGADPVSNPERLVCCAMVGANCALIDSATVPLTLHFFCCTSSLSTTFSLVVAATYSECGLRGMKREQGELAIGR